MLGEAEYMNSLYLKEIYLFISKKLSTQKTPGSDGFTADFCQIFFV